MAFAVRLDQNPLVSLQKIDFPLCNLPPEILLHIFSYIPRHNLPATMLVSRHFHTLSIASANREASSTIKSFKQCLDKRLDFTPAQTQGLQAIPDQLHSETLIQWKHRLLYIEKEFIKILDTCDAPTTACLQTDALPPSFMKIIFEMMAIQKKVEEALQEPPYQKKYILLSCVRRSLKIETMIRAFSIAVEIPASDLQALAFEEIAEQHLHMGFLQKAREAADRILDVHSRDRLLRKIAKGYLDTADIPETITTARMIVNLEQRSEALRDIVETHLKAHDVGSALEIIPIMPHGIIKDSTLFEISQAMLPIDIERALGVALQIEWDQKKAEALQPICLRFLERGNLSRADEIAALMPDGNIKNYTMGMLDTMRE